MSPVTRRRAGVASGVVVALAASSLTFFAVQSKGETVHEADLNDGGVWVSATNYSQFARMNKAARQFDAGIQANVTPGAGLDVLQDGAAVGGILTSGNQLVPIDPLTGRLDSTSPVQLPQKAKPVGDEFVPATGDLRGGTLAMVDPKTGKVWAQRVDPDVPLSGLSLSTAAKPLATVGAVAAMAVDTSGGVHVVSAATGKVVSVPVSGGSFGAPGHREDQAHSQGRRHHRGRHPLGRLQPGLRPGLRPGPRQARRRWRRAPRRHVVCRLAAARSRCGLRRARDDDRAQGRRPRRRKPGQGGVRLPSQVGPGAERPKVSRPVRLGDCVYAAWARPAKAYYSVNCGKAEPGAGRHPSTSQVTRRARRRGVPGQPWAHRAQRPGQRQRLGPRPKPSRSTTGTR